MAKGYSQTYGLDYEETFSSMAKLETNRVVLSFEVDITIVVSLKWTLHQMHVKNIFLNGFLRNKCL